MFTAHAPFILAPDDDTLSGWKAAAIDAQHDWKHRGQVTPPANIVYMGRAYAPVGEDWSNRYMVAYFKAYSIIYYGLYLAHMDEIDHKRSADTFGVKGE